MPQTLLHRSSASSRVAPRSALSGVLAAAIGAVIAWFTVPALTAAYNEGFQATIAMNAMGILHGNLRDIDLLYPLDNDFFVLTRFGLSLLLAGLMALGLPALVAFRVIMLLSLAGLVAANAAILVRCYRVNPVLALLPALLFPGLFESAWFFNDNLLSAALSSAALAVFWIRPSLPATAASAVLWGLAVACRTDAVLLAPAFLILLATQLPDTRSRVRHGLLAAPIAVAVPLLVYGAFGLNLLDVLALTRRATIAWARQDPLTHVLMPALKGFSPPGMLAMAAGTVAVLARRRWREALLCLGVPLVFVLAYGRMLTEVRYLLPLTPFFGILMAEGWRGMRRLGRGAQGACLAGLAASVLLCLAPPLLLPDRRLHFLSADHDMPRPSVGRIWSPVLALWWNRTLQDGYDATAAALVRVAASGGGIVVSTYWTPDRIVDLLLREQGFEGARATPASCAGIGEVFTRQGIRVLHLRAHTPMLPTERSAVTWAALGAPCLQDVGVAPHDPVLLAGWMKLDEPPAALARPAVSVLYLPQTDIHPRARDVAALTYAFYLATARAEDVPLFLHAPEDADAARAAAAALSARAMLQ